MKRLLVIALATVAALAVSSYALAECGNGVVDPGEECEPTTFEVCTNNQDDDGDGFLDCLDPDCTPEGTGTMFTCGQDCYAVPTCQPLLDDPARMTFKMPKRFDYLKMSARGILNTEINPDVEDVNFVVSNVGGVVYSEQLPPGSFVPNSSGTSFKFKRRRDKITPGMYNYVIKKKYVKKTDTNEVIVKPKMEGDFGLADPLRNTIYTEAELATMTIQLSIGNDVFYITAPYERKRNGWYLRDKYMVAP